MHCGSCDIIPFWKWLNETQKYPTSIICNDFDGEYLPKVQLNNVNDCSGEYLCTWFWKCYHIYCIYIKNIDPLFYEGNFEDTNSKDHKMAKGRRTNTDL